MLLDMSEVWALKGIGLSFWLFGQGSSLLEDLICYNWVILSNVKGFEDLAVLISGLDGLACSTIRPGVVEFS